MKSVVAKISNVRAFFTAGQALLDSSVHTPRIGVGFGRTGDGKSRTVSSWATATNAAYVRAMATWRSPGPMLAAICLELGITPRSRHSETIKLICEVLARSEKLRPLLIDEADFLVRFPQLLDVLRDVHDIAGVPVILIGMQHFLSRLLSLREQEQFCSRISQVIEFKPLTRQDAATLLDAIGDVKVEPDLVDRLHKECDGSARLLVVAMEQIERYATTHDLGTVGKADVEKLKFTLDRRPELLDRLGLRGSHQVVA